MTTQSPAKERLKLNIVKLYQVEKVGQKGIDKLAFTAYPDGSDPKNAVKYFTFHKSIFEFILEGAVIDVDIEVSQRQYQGDTYTDRKVVQLYQDGKEVVEARKPGPWKGGGGEYKKDTASIEGQTAAKILGEAWCAGKLAENSIEVKELRQWCLSRLKAKTAAEAPAEAVKEEKLSTLSDEFWKACKAAGYGIDTKKGKDGVQAWLTKNFKTTIPFEELSDDYQRKALDLMKKEELPFS